MDSTSYQTEDIKPFEANIDDLMNNKILREIGGPDTEIRPLQHTMCHLLSCKHTLESFTTRKTIRTDANLACERGIYERQWSWLCSLCKLSVYNWYHNVVWDDVDDEPVDFEIFDLSISLEHLDDCSIAAEQTYYEEFQNGWATRERLEELKQEWLEASREHNRVSEKMDKLRAEIEDRKSFCDQGGD